MSSSQNGFSVQCPLPHPTGETIQMAHGGGGKIMQRLLQQTILPVISTGRSVQSTTDAATLDLPSGARLAFTTDSFVIRPLEFPGGDIGSLAVHGTVNDLAMSGARPLYISVGLILEEGLPVDVLTRILQSMRKSAQEAHVQIVTGDTKVVDRGKGDGIYINTAGIGVISSGLPVIAPGSIQSGDAILVNGDLGRHGIAVMAVREGLEFETEIESDSAPLAGLVQHLLDAGIEIHCMRDLTRGGLSSALNEIAEAANCSIALTEDLIPIREDVRGACEILGLDPLYVANEGRMVAIVAAHHAERALEVMRGHPNGRSAVKIGTVQSQPSVAPVILQTSFGPARILDMLSGEQLPRIC